MERVTVMVSFCRSQDTEALGLTDLRSSLNPLLSVPRPHPSLLMCKVHLIGQGPYYLRAFGLNCSFCQEHDLPPSSLHSELRLLSFLALDQILIAHWEAVPESPSRSSHTSPCHDLGICVCVCVCSFGFC